MLGNRTNYGKGRHAIRLTVRLYDGLRDMIDNYADGLGVSRADAVVFIMKKYHDRYVEPMQDKTRLVQKRDICVIAEDLLIACVNMTDSEGKRSPVRVPAEDAYRLALEMVRRLARMKIPPGVIG